MPITTPQVDGFIRKNKLWEPLLSALRAVLLDTPLVEEMKWRVPCYTFEGGNVVLVTVLKASCVIGFVKGALLKDPAGVLFKQGPNMQSSRSMRFTTAEDVNAQAATIKAYVAEAVELEKAGAKVRFKSTADFDLPEELATTFSNQPELKKAFYALTPGRQRGYLLHFSSAKQSATRQARIDKAVADILAGKGINDDYQAAGREKKVPKKTIAKK